MTEKVTSTEARQGRKGKHVLAILVVSLVLCVIALVFFEALPGISS